MSLRRLLWLAVPLAGIAELAAHLVFAQRAPGPDAWTGLRAPLAALHKQGDLIVVAPGWADPLARQAFGEAFMPLADVARPDATAYPRAIEISLLGEHASELAGWRELTSRAIDGFRLRVLVNPAPVPVRFDFVGALAPEHVAVFQGPSDDRTCGFTDSAPVSSGSLPSPPTFPSRRFQCAGGDQYFVGVTVIDDEQYRPRRCIWAHPVPAGPLRIVYRAVPLGRVLRGYAMLPWLIMRDAKGTPIRLRALVGGEPLGTFVHHDGEGWTHFEFSTGAHAGRSEDVTFEITSDNLQDRHFCFQADTR